MAFNLFNFSELGWISSMKPVTQVPAATGSGFMSATSQVQKPAVNTGMFDTYMQDPKISKQWKSKMLSDLQSGVITEDDANSIIENIYKTQESDQSFLWGAFEKTIEWAKKGISRIGEAGEGLKAGKYNFAEAAVRGSAGALETAFSPVSGVLGQGVQEWIEELSPETRKSVWEFANPKIQAAKQWYDSQTPEQKRNLDNIGVGFEVLANFVWAKAVQKSGEAVVKTGKPIIQATGRLATATGKNIAKTPWIIKKWVSSLDDTIDAGVERLAGKALGSSDGSKELFKATSPSYNTLAKSKDIRKIVEKAKVADDAIIAYGKKPTTTSERVTAYNETMKSVWSDIEKVRWSVKTKYNAWDLADVIDEEISKISVWGVVNPALKSDIDALMKQSEYFRKIGQVDIPTLGNQRTLINAMTDWGSTTQFGNTFSSTMKKVASKIRESEDAIIGSSGGWKVWEKLRQYGALRSMYDDIVKQDIKALRSKWMGIEESFGRISGISETLWGIAQIVFNPKQALPSILSGGSKVLLGKVAWKLKDPDYLIKTGYEKLLKSKPSKNGTVRGNTTTPSTGLNLKAPLRSIPEKVTKPLPLKPAGKDPLQAKYDMENAKSKPIVLKSSSNQTQLTKISTVSGENKEIIGLTEKSWIKNVTPSNQVKYNQWSGYKPVRMALDSKDSEISRYWAIDWRAMKSWEYSKQDFASFKEIESKLWMTRADIIKRADELKDIAKKARSRNEEVLVDLRIKPAGNATKSPTQSLKSNELPIQKGVNAPTVGKPAVIARKGVSLSNIGKENGGFVALPKIWNNPWEISLSTQNIASKSPIVSESLSPLVEQAKSFWYEVKLVNKKPVKFLWKHFSDSKTIEIYTKWRTPEQISDTLHHETWHIVDYKRRWIVPDPMGDSVIGFDGKLRPAMDSDVYFRNEYMKKEADAIRKEFDRSDSLSTTQKEIWADAYKFYKKSPDKLKSVAPNMYKILEEFLGVKSK